MSPGFLDALFIFLHQPGHNSRLAVTAVQPPDSLSRLEPIHLLSCQVDEHKAVDAAICLLQAIPDLCQRLFAARGFVDKLLATLVRRNSSHLIAQIDLVKWLVVDDEDSPIDRLRLDVVETERHLPHAILKV